MNIDEIVVYPDRNTNIEKYHQYFQTSNPVKAFDGLSLVCNTGADYDYLGLITQDILVSILHLNLRNDMWQITYAQSEPDYQNQGCFRYLITANLESGVPERRKSENWLCPQLGMLSSHSVPTREITYRTSVLKRFRPCRARRFELESGRYLAAACRVACQRLPLDAAQASTAAVETG